MPISFTDIPNSIRVPGTYVEINNTRAVQGLGQFNPRALLFGQRLSTGSVAANVATLVTSYEQAVQYFGRGSMLATMFKTFKANNQYTETWAIAQDDNGAGVAGTQTITVTGTATASGTINLYIAGQLIPVLVTSGDLQNAIASAINTAIGLNPDLLVSSTVSTNVVTLTCRHKGLIGNDVDVRHNFYGPSSGEVLPAGVTVAIAAGTAGTTNPDVATAIAALPVETYDVLVFPYTDVSNIGKLETELNGRWGGLRMLEGHAFSALRGTVGTLQSFGAARNNQHVTIMGFNNSPSLAIEWASAYAAQTVFSYGADPARQVATLPLIGILAPPRGSRFIQTERNTLLYDGIATYTVSSDDVVRIERAITTYQVNSAGAQDPSYLDTETLLLLAYLRMTARTRLMLKFPRFKLADDGFRYSAGQAIVTPSIIKSELIALATEWREVGLIEDLPQFIQDLIVERNKNDPNRVDALLPPNLVNNLRVLAAQIQFLV